VRYAEIRSEKGLEGKFYTLLDKGKGKPLILMISETFHLKDKDIGKSLASLSVWWVG
jgi:hypothetical protein